jgi:hypothetical protein
MSEPRFQSPVHEIGERMDRIPLPVLRATAWWVAAELVGRHRDDLYIIDATAGGGLHQGLAVRSWRPAPYTSRVVFLGCGGHLTPGHRKHSERFNWFEVIAAHDRRRHVIEQLERSVEYEQQACDALAGTGLRPPTYRPWGMNSNA